MSFHHILSDLVSDFGKGPGLFLKHCGAIFVGDHKAFSFEVSRQFGCQDCLGTGCFFNGPPNPK